jgi:nitroimidazol reductase NimA-like FMN-containing flavoprotein (pyridoxamine 5'-phosphate oxidase superfamily)
MIGELFPDEIEHVLQAEQIGRLGVTDGERVYIFPICYGYDGRCIYVAARPGLKLRLMQQHPEVCIEVEQIESTTHWRTVMAHGRFQEITEPTARDDALALIAAQAGDDHPLSLAPYMDGPDATVVFRIQLAEKTGRYEREEIFRHVRPAAPPRPHDQEQPAERSD